MRVKFLLNQVANPFSITINPLFLFIKTYYDMYGLDKSIEWLRCEHVIFHDVDTQAQMVVNEQPDVVGLSVFIWNDSYQFELAKKIKSLDPNIVIVLGGPQLDAHKNSQFFHAHPYVDYVCYGDGERAFQLLIDKISNLSSEPLVNMVENKNQQAIVHPYELLSCQEYFDTSAILAQKDLLIQTIDYLEQHNIKKSQLYISVEFARGCMYSCTFCDWSQNLTKKVKRRGHNWKAEIDLIHELDIKMRETDANFGQWKQDIEIFDYAISLYDPNRNFKFDVSNTSKLNKDATFHIMTQQALIYDALAIVSIQDFNPEVLSAINRPGLSEDQQIDFIKRLISTLGEKARNVYTQIIVGLPGQTYDTIKDTMIKTLNIGVQNHMLYPFAYLINSPAADPVYEKIHGLKWMKTVAINGYYRDLDFDQVGVTADNIEDIYKKAANNDLIDGQWASSTTIYQTRNMSFYDLICSHIFLTLTKQFQDKLVWKGATVDFNRLRNMLDSKVRQYADRYFEVHGPLIEKYNLFVLGIPELDSNKLLKVAAVI